MKTTKKELMDILSTKPSHFMGVAHRLVSDDELEKVLNEYCDEVDDGALFERRECMRKLSNGIVFTGGSRVEFGGSDTRVDKIENDRGILYAIAKVYTSDCYGNSIDTLVYVVDK